jgi:anti-sigma regulatory factor (Ser/Thr protein kinase)
VTTGGYVHDALLYGADEELLRDAVPFLRAGVAAGETTMVVGTDRTAALLRDGLDGDPRVKFASSAEVYRRAPQTILAFRKLLEREVAAGTPRVRVLGELVFGEQPATWSKWLGYEAVINHALAPYPAWGVCIFDTRRLPGEVLAAVGLTHPYLRTAASRASNPRYLDPAEFLRRLAEAEPDPLEATQPALEVEDLTDLRRLRQQLHAAVAGSALASETKSEFVFASSEVATNALRHGRRPVRVRAWASPGRLLCTVTDHGAGIDDPFAGYLPVHSDPAREGLGLWLARSLCDHITFHRTADGFTVRLATGAELT